MGTKKAHPADGAAGQAKAGMQLGQAAIPPSQDTTSGRGSQVTVSDFLEVGEENGRTMKQLLQFLNGDPRTVRLEIERERKKGCPILSGQRGYWLCGSPEEANRFCRSMRSRARQIWATARAVETAVGLPQHEPQQLDGQVVFF